MSGSIFVTGVAIACAYLLFRFIEMRFILKENKPLKTIIIDTIFVYFCVIISFVLIDQFNLKTKTLTEAPVFIDNPKF